MILWFLDWDRYFTSIHLGIILLKLTDETIFTSSDGPAETGRSAGLVRVVRATSSAYSFPLQHCPTMLKEMGGGGGTINY